MTIEETIRLLNKNYFNAEESNSLSENTSALEQLDGIIRAPIF